MMMVMVLMMGTIAMVIQSWRWRWFGDDAEPDDGDYADDDDGVDDEDEDGRDENDGDGDDDAAFSQCATTKTIRVATQT